MRRLQEGELFGEQAVAIVERAKAYAACSQRASGEERGLIDGLFGGGAADCEAAAFYLGAVAQKSHDEHRCGQLLMAEQGNVQAAEALLLARRVGGNARRAPLVVMQSNTQQSKTKQRRQSEMRKKLKPRQRERLQKEQRKTRKLLTRQPKKRKKQRSTSTSGAIDQLA